jgi:hypothetical protein
MGRSLVDQRERNGQSRSQRPRSNPLESKIHVLLDAESAHRFNIFESSRWSLARADQHVQRPFVERHNCGMRSHYPENTNSAIRNDRQRMVAIGNSSRGDCTKWPGTFNPRGQRLSTGTRSTLA